MQATSPSAARGSVAVPPWAKPPSDVDESSRLAVIRATHPPHELLVYQLCRARESLLAVSTRMNANGHINIKNNIRLAKSDWRRDLPYCIEQSKLGGQIVLNRYYKPLGFRDASEMLNYDEDPAYSIFHIHRAHLTDANLLRGRLTPPHCGWFYDDVTAPWLGRRALERYFERFDQAFGHLLLNF